LNLWIKLFLWFFKNVLLIRGPKSLIHWSHSYAYEKKPQNSNQKTFYARHWWLRLVILAPQEAGIRRIAV
jgi:hypothetical protein